MRNNKNNRQFSFLNHSKSNGKFGLPDVSGFDFVKHHVVSEKRVGIMSANKNTSCASINCV